MRLRRFIEPHGSVPAAQRTQARLLSGLLLVLVLLGGVPVALSLAGLVGQPIWVGGGWVLLVAAYGLSRTAYAQWAARLILVASAVAPWVMALSRGPQASSIASDLAFAAVSLILSGLLFSERATIVVAGIQFFGMWAAGTVYPARFASGELATLLIFIGIFSVLAGAGALNLRVEREEAERQRAARLSADERFHLVSYATNDVVWEWELATGRVWRNLGIQRLFGYPPDQIGADMAWWEARIHPDDREKVMQGLRAAIDSGERFWSKEYRFQRVDQTYADIFDRAYIRRDDAGEPTSVQGAVMDITARNHAEEILRQEAVHDPLTGLFNRRYMEEMLEREIRLAHSNHQAISIIMLDIDNFKQVNDTYGHAAGDAMLRTLGSFLLQHVRGTDIACRYGGDEFVLILPNASLDVARQRAELLRLGARELKVALYGEPLGALSLSMGVVLFPEHGGTREAIMKAVDSALYGAKTGGRNQVFVAPL